MRALLAALLMVVVSGCGTREPSAKRRNLKCDEATQAAREEFIDKLIERKIFTKVTTGVTVPKVWVGPGFYAIDFETKQKFVEVAFAYFACGEQPEVTVVKLLNSMDGKEVGTYDDAFGLQLD